MAKRYETAQVGCSSGAFRCYNDNVVLSVRLDFSSPGCRNEAAPAKIDTGYGNDATHG
jgi:hypothetical protein